MLALKMGENLSQQLNKASPLDLLLHVHKEMTDNLDLITCANNFVSGSDHHQQVFGKFSDQAITYRDK